MSLYIPARVNPAYIQYYRKMNQLGRMNRKMQTPAPCKAIRAQRIHDACRFFKASDGAYVFQKRQMKEAANGSDLLRS